MPNNGSILLLLLFCITLLLNVITGAAAVPLPDNLIVTVTVNNEDLELNLYKRSIRADNYELRYWDTVSGYFVSTPTEIRTYRGTVTGKPNHLVVGAIFPNGIANLMSPNGKTYYWKLDHYDLSDQLPSSTVVASADSNFSVEPEEIMEELLDINDEIYTNTADDMMLDDAVEGDDSETRRLGVHPPMSSLLPPTNIGMKTAELAYDVPYYYLHEKAGGNIDYAVAQVEYRVNVYDHFMSRDPMIRIVLSQIVMRVDEFYKDPLPADNVDLLKRVKQEWKYSELFDTPWDMVNALDCNSMISGGVAYTSQIGKNKDAFGVKVLHHENGHNWGAQHRAYAKDTMDQNNPHHGPLNIERVINMKNKKYDEGYLDDYNELYPDPLHPYAHVDLATTLMNTAVDIPVLDNDWDGNGDLISIKSFSTSTANGGTVIQVGNALRYTPPTGYVGKEIIYYEVADSTGLYNRDLVHIEVINHDLAVQYNFDDDDTPGMAIDNSGHGHPGRYAGDIIGGVVGLGIHLTGIFTADYRNLLPPDVKLGTKSIDYPLDPYQSLGCAFDPMDESYTLAFWFKTEDVVGKHYVARKDFVRDGTAYGFQFVIQDGELNWNMREFYGLAPTKRGQLGTIVPTEWTHIAMVIDRASDTLFLYKDGGVLHQTTLASGSWIFMGRGALRFGHDDTYNGMSFDDVQVYTRALALEEVCSIGVDLGGKPSPRREIFEAEDAPVFVGASIKSDIAGFSGMGFIEYQNSGSSAFVEWEIIIHETGDYDLLFQYALDDDSGGREMDIILDGTIISPNLNFVNLGSWKMWSTTNPIRTSLNAGMHRLRVSVTGLSGPNIDYVAVQEVLNNVNTPPRFTVDIIHMKAVPNVAVSGSLVEHALDWDVGDTLSFAKTKGPNYLTVFNDGIFVGTPRTDMIGTNDFTVKVIDATGESSEATLRIEVQPFPNDIIDFNDYSIVSYHENQDKEGTATVKDYGATIRLFGNVYKAIEFPYVVTLDTVLEFDFRSSRIGEVHAIGLDENLDNTERYYFQLCGTQSISKAITNFNNYVNYEPFVKHYVIPVGQFYTGSKMHLVFVNDHDVTNPNAESIYSNVKIYEQTVPTQTPIDISVVDLTSFQQYTSLEAFYALDSPAYFVVTDSAIGPTEPTWWGDLPDKSRTTLYIPLMSMSCLGGDDGLDTSVIAAVKAQQTASCDDGSSLDPWQMNAGRSLNECGHSLVLTMDDDDSNPWLNDYKLQGCTFESTGGTPVTFNARKWNDVDEQIGSLSLTFRFAIIPSVPLLQTNVNGSCNGNDNKCGECVGNCKNDKHCDWGLICFQRDGITEVQGCAGSGKSDKNYCVVPTTPNTLVLMGQNQDPASSYPLDKCQGDCDKDSDCGFDDGEVSNLICKQRSADEDVPGCVGTPPDGKDYCYDPADDPNNGLLF